MPASPPFPNRVPLGHALLLFALILLAYRSVGQAGFQFDDFNVIVLNPAVHSLQAWWDSMPGIRPLLKLGYSLNWIWSEQASGFHWTNLAIHLGNSLLVYLLMAQWVRLTLPDCQQAGRIALLGSLIFALHPANTEVVTYISGRSVGQMSLFYLAGLVGYLSWRGGQGGGRLWFFTLSAFLLALASKEIAWTFPLALALMVWLAREPVLKQTWPAWLAGLAGLAIIFSLDRYRSLVQTSLETRGIVENLWTQVEGLHYLITHPLLGLHSNIDPDLPARLAYAPDLAWKLVLPAGLLLVALSQIRRRPWLSLGIAWFFLHLLPTNSLLARLDVANDRQLYLALLGPAFILAVLLQRVWALARVPLVLALVLILAAHTHARNQDYRDEISLWLATTRDSPGKARAWNNLGFAHQEAGQWGEAETAYLKALALDPEYERAQANLDEVRRHLIPSPTDMPGQGT